MMLDKKMTDFIEELSSSNPTPGGGGTSSLVGALAASLGLMVTHLTIGKKKYAMYEEEVIKIKEELSILQNKLISLIDEDAKAFLPLSKAYKLPKDTEEEKEKKEKVMENALYKASLVPISIMETIFQTMQSLEILSKKGSMLAISDVGVGILFAQAAIESASLNVFINTNMMKNKEIASQLNKKAENIIQESVKIKNRTYTYVLNSIK